MQRSFNLILLLVSVFLIYFSFTAHTTLSRFQSLINQLNQYSLDKTATAALDQTELLAQLERLHTRLPWDADLTSALSTVANNLANETVQKGRQQILASKTHEYYQQSLSYRPRDVEVLSGQMELLIDQGAPVDYILPKLDAVISLVPKDQDLKAQLALICFKLLSVNPQSQAQSRITERLQRLFDYSMDYRGLILVRRYARLYGQEETLKKILSQYN